MITHTGTGGDIMTLGIDDNHGNSVALMRDPDGTMGITAFSPITPETTTAALASGGMCTVAQLTEEDRRALAAELLKGLDN